MGSGNDKTMGVLDVLKIPVRFLTRYWLILIAEITLMILAGIGFIWFFHNRALLITGGVMIVVSIVFAIVFFVKWVTMRYNIRQQLIATYGRECCTPVLGNGVKVSPDEQGNRSPRA